MNCEECGCNVAMMINSKDCECVNCGKPLVCSDWTGRNRNEEIDWGDPSKRHKYRSSN